MIQPSLDISSRSTFFSRKKLFPPPKLVITFPAGGAFSAICVVCREECRSDYEKKEHILLSHPWSFLRAQVEETIAKFGTEIENSENPKITDNLKMALADHIESIPENKNEVDDNEIKSAICGTTFENSNE